MSVAEHDFTDTPTFAVLEFRASMWDRLVAAFFRALWSSLVVWVLLMVALHFAPLGKLRPRGKMRLRIATTLAIPIALAMGAHRFATRFHTLRFSGDQIELVSLRRTLPIDPLQVDGLLAVDGVRYYVGELVYWKQTLVLAGGEAHALSFDAASNALCYEQLRERCVHAWGLPYTAQLETPQAGPELSPDEYVTALSHLQRHFLMQTYKKVVVGMLMAGGGVTAMIALWMNPGVGPRNSRVYIWLGVFALIGLVLVFRAVRQFGVAWKIRQVKWRLSEAM